MQLECTHPHDRRAKRCRNCENASRVRPEVERFWSHIDKSGDCWLWTGYANPTSGYGTWTTTWGKTVYVHRYSYELAFGEIPEDHQVDHECQTILCVRPDHLKAVTGHENNWRAQERNQSGRFKTHCVKGHPLDEANTYVDPSGKRHCKTCRQATLQQFRARQRSHPSLLAPVGA